jgi:hypothetical protein
MGGRGSSNPIQVGRTVTVHHSVYGDVRGTISRINGRGNFYLSNARRLSNGREIPHTTVFSFPDLLKDISPQTPKGKQ